MNHLLGQLNRWRLVERLIRLAWGGGRWIAIVGVLLGAACLTDWLADRYLGSETWRKVRKASWVFAPAPSATAEERWFSEHLRLHYGLRLPPAVIVDDTPKWLRVGMTGAQLLLAAGLAYFLLLRPWLRTPSVDVLAGEAEKEIPEFGHRLVTAVQLNREGARTEGMSQALIAEVTREAGEMASHHNLLKLVNYTRVILAVAVALPVLAAWGAFVVVKPELAGVLLKRQMLLNIEIPRTVFLKNVSQEVWPTGSETEVRYKVTGEYDSTMVGRLRVEPDGQPEEYYDLKPERFKLTDQTFETLRKEKVPEAVIVKLDSLKNKDFLRREDLAGATSGVLDKDELAQFQNFVLDSALERDAEGGAIFSAKLPPSSSDFSFSARLGSGRTRELGRIRFEAPPQAVELESWQLLPRFLGTRDGKPGGPLFERQNDGAKRGEIVEALPLSEVRIGAVFSKPIKSALLIPIERGEGIRERELPALKPLGMDDERLAAEWKFPTTEKMIGYRIDLVDDRGFVNAVPIRRNVRMLEDRPPVVTFMPESTRHPNPEDFDGQGDPRVFDWGDKMPLAEGGRVMVIYHARSEQGISRANIRYRVYPKGIAPDAYPEDIQKIQHPRDDPEAKVFARLALKPITADLKVVGNYVPELGLFEKSWEGLTGLKRPDRMKVSIEYYSFPSPDPAHVPAGLEAGGRYMFEIDGLLKTLPDGSTAKLEIGDTVQLYVEAFDKNPLPNRPPGYTKEARRKIVVNSEDAAYAIKMRDEQNKRLQDKLRELANDQANVFKPKDQEPPKKKP